MSAREKSVRAPVRVVRGELARRTEDETADANRLRTLTVPASECHSVRVPRYRGDRRCDHRRRRAFRGVDILREHQAMASKPAEIRPPSRVNDRV